MKKKDIKYYLNLPYKTIIMPDPYGVFFAEVEGLSGCMTQGETEEEALKNIKEAKELWLETAIKRGIKIREPKESDFEFLSKYHKKLDPRWIREQKRNNERSTPKSFRENVIKRIPLVMSLKKAES